MISTSKTPELSIIVPLFNEQNRLDKCLKTLLGFIALQELDAEILLVPNGCWDDTLQKCLAWHDKFPQTIQVLPLLTRGKGAAIRAGMLEARGARRYMADVDLSTPASEILYFINCLRAGYDVVIGSRAEAGQGHTTLKRRVMSRAFHFVTALVVPGIQDTQCGFKLFTAEAAKKIFEQVKITGWAVDVEILFLAQRLGLMVYEMPVEWRHNFDSRVSPVRDSLTMLADVLKIPLSHARYSIVKAPR